MKAEQSSHDDTARPISTPTAAKRRKNAAHGASRGEESKTDQPQRGERLVATYLLA